MAAAMGMLGASAIQQAGQTGSRNKREPGIMMRVDRLIVLG